MNNFFVTVFAIFAFSQASLASSEPGQSINDRVASDHAPNKLLISFHSWVSQAHKNSFEGEFELTQIRRFNSNNNLVLYQFPENLSVHQMLAMLENQAEIVRVDPDYKLDLHSLATTPNDPLYPMQWGLNNTGQQINGTNGVVGVDIKAAEAWDIQTGDGSCTLAIIDSGVDYDHEDLTANMWVNPGEVPGDGLDNDANGYIDDIHGWDFADNDADPKGPNFHGTAVAGIAGAVGNNALGMTGVAWNVKLMALKVFPDNPADSATLSMFLSALDYAVTNGARVSNHSYTVGSTFLPNFKMAIDTAGQNGHLIVAAAGNGSTDNDITAVYPSSFTSDNVIAVTSLGNQGELASGSNYGAQSVDLAAPGRYNYATFPGNLYTQNLAVTSFAAPMVSGAACLIDMQDPGLSLEQLRNRILTNTTPIASMNGITKTGGVLNLYDSLLSDPVLNYDCDFYVLKSVSICL